MRTLKSITAIALMLSFAATVNAETTMSKPNAKIPPGVEELAIGAKAPSFKLLGTDEKMHSLDDLRGEKGTLIVYTCNHCPYAIAYEDRLIALATEYQAKGIGVAAISCNDPDSYPDDGFKAMQARATEKELPYPYLFDETQAVALKYGPLVTPHIFLFDSNLKLVYRGRVDNSAKPDEVNERDLNNALSALAAGKTIDVKETTAFGCSIKWKADVLKTGKVAKTEKSSMMEKEG